LTIDEVIDTHVTCIEIRPGNLVIKLVKRKDTKPRAQRDLTLHIPWHKPPSKRRREILLPDAIEPQTLVVDRTAFVAVPARRGEVRHQISHSR
jgi:hypothetical protein